LNSITYSSRSHQQSFLRFPLRTPYHFVVSLHHLQGSHVLTRCISHSEPSQAAGSAIAGDCPINDIVLATPQFRDDRFNGPMRLLQVARQNRFSQLRRLPCLTAMVMPVPESNIVLFIDEGQFRRECIQHGAKLFFRYIAEQLPRFPFCFFGEPSSPRSEPCPLQRVWPLRPC